MSSELEGRHALVVATARYSDPKLQQLRAPAADAERLADVLRDPAKGNFDVEVVMDESQATLTRRIASFFRDRRPNELLLLHFSCHGVKDDRGELYLAASDTELDLLSATGVSAAWLNDQISRTRSRRTVVLLDCCFSGAFPFGMRARGGGNVDAPGHFEGRGRAIIAASSGMEYAYEGDQLEGEGQPSVFTEAVVEGLETGEADLDHDQLVSVDDLYGYVFDRVKERTPSQTPTKKSEIEGPLYLARSTRWPPLKRRALDPELLGRTEDRYAGIRVGAVQELAQLLMSRDPQVAIAAREALSRMIDDDSRQVSASARAALAAGQEKHERTDAERTERERRQRGQADRDQGHRDRDVSKQAPIESAGAAEGVGNSAFELARTPDAAVGREEPAKASWPRRHPRLTIASVVIVVAAAGIAIIATQGGGGRQPRTSSSSPQYHALLSLLPASIRPSCRNDSTHGGGTWLINDGANSQAVCVTPHASYLTYGLWPSHSEAGAWVTSTRDPTAVPCQTRTTTAMQRILPGAMTNCEDDRNPHNPGIAMSWTEHGSRIAGWISWGHHNPDAALTQWQSVAKAR